MLKNFALGFVVAGLLATPALAQKYVPEAGSGNLVQGPGGAPVTPDTPAYVGQKSGEAYNYDKRSTNGQAVHHQTKKPRQINPQHD